MPKIRTETGGLRGRGRPAPGFTLIEIVIVVAIMGIMLAVAAPWFAKFTRRWQLQSYASEIRSTLLAARISAVRRNAPATVSVTVAGAGEDSHTFTTIYPPPPGPTPPPRVLSLPSLRFDIPVTPPGGVITFGGDGRVVAPPDPTPGQIVIQAPPGGASPNQITIQADPSGRVQVITPTVWN